MLLSILTWSLLLYRIGPQVSHDGLLGLLVFMLLGLIAGRIARALIRGAPRMGLMATTLLGMAGSFLGGLIGSLLRRDGRVFDLHPSGLIMSVLGAVLLLLPMKRFVRGSTGLPSKEVGNS